MLDSLGPEAARLSREQEALLPLYREHWRNVRNATAPADRAAAERGVALAYAEAQLAPPEQVIWCDSPVAIERSRKAAWYDIDAGENVKLRIVEGVVRRVKTLVDDHVPVRVRVGAATGLEFENQYFRASAMLNSALAEHAARVGWSAVARRQALLSRLFRRGKRTAFTSFADGRWLQHEHLGLLAIFAYLHNVGGYIAQTAALQGLWQVATNAGAMVPHERVCWLSDRHDVLEVDALGRLHSAAGPAVRYRDDWCFFAWKGVEVPAWMILHPERIQAYLVERERNPVIRHCMIEIMTPRRYIESGAPSRFAVDDVGTLWRKQWLDWRDAWAAVEVINGTPEPDGTRKHYFLQVPPDMRTPTEAVAWTYGINAKRYAELTART